MKKIKEQINKFFQGRYGLDELGKCFLFISVGIYLVGITIKSKLLIWISIAGNMYVFYRMFSREPNHRIEENWRYCRYVKLWKIRYQERKTARIFMCAKCGRYVMIPNGRGKVQITCTSCGHKFIGST